VCTANGTTYDNKCWHELSYCRGLENNLVYHPGSCEGKIRPQTENHAQITTTTTTTTTTNKRTKTNIILTSKEERDIKWLALH